MRSINSFWRIYGARKNKKEKHEQQQQQKKEGTRDSKKEEKRRNQRHPNGKNVSKLNGDGGGDCCVH